jgi:PAS domain S-box-containing protein
VVNGLQTTGEALELKEAPMPEETHSYRWTGEFADSRLEDAYLRASWPELSSRFNSVLFGVYVFVSWAIFDLIALGWGWTFVALTAGRLAALGATLLALKVFNSPDDKRSFLACAAFTQLLVCIIAPTSLMLGEVNFAAALLSIIVILFAFYVGVPVRLSINLALSLALCAGFVLVTPTLAVVDGYTLLQICALFAVVNAIGVEMVRAANRLRRDGFMTLIRQNELYEQWRAEAESRREAEANMRETEESFQSIFYAAPLPIALIDPTKFVVIQANVAALNLFGLTEEEAARTDTRDLFDEGDLLKRIDTLLASSRRGMPIEFRMKRRDGKRIDALVTAATGRFQGQRVLLIGIQDITEKRREAEALREARDQATAASRSKSEFLANMSHELRTPLNAIIGFSEALERELFGPIGSPRYREYAEDIRDSGVHLLSLINDILDLSKIEAGHFKLHEDEAELDRIIETATRIVRHRAAQANIALEVTLPEPPVTLVADERALKQVLINLVSNAVKFSPDGSLVRVNTHLGPDTLRISVSDQGAGIAAEDIPRALTPFTQLDGSLSRAHEGTGLGLPLAKHLTELHGGKLTIESVVGKGTVVHVDLPLDRVVSHDVGKAKAAF